MIVTRVIWTSYRLHHSSLCNILEYQTNHTYIYFVHFISYWYAVSPSWQWWTDQLLILLLHISHIPGVCFVLKLICMLGKSKGLHLNGETNC